MNDYTYTHIRSHGMSLLQGNGQPVPEDWRDQLALRLGKRPRRIGVWAELALFGALRCMDSKGMAGLSPHAVLRVASQFGPAESLDLVGRSCAEGVLPMPFDFLQSQPSQMLAALSQHLAWRGDACFVALDEGQALLARAQREAHGLRQQAEAAQRPWAGLLLGRVDLAPVPVSDWQWIA